MDRKLSTPVISNIPKHGAKPYRSLRAEISSSVLRRPIIEVIPEDTAEQDIERKSNQTVTTPRPSSYGGEKVDFEIEKRLSKTDKTAKTNSQSSINNEKSNESNQSLSKQSRSSIRSEQSNTTAPPKQKIKVYDRTISIAPSTISRPTSSNHNLGSVHFNNGQANPSFDGSQTNLGSQNSTSSTQVYSEQYEQYCSCPTICLCRSWTKREKILFAIVTGLVLVVCTLAALVGVLIDKR